jgi:hypothetical protein
MQITKKELKRLLKQWPSQEMGDEVKAAVK